MIAIIFYGFFVLLTTAFVADGIEILIRARAFNRNQLNLTKFRDEFIEKYDLDFTVILPAYRKPQEDLKRSIHSLLKAGIPKNQILVVDDFSDDQFKTAGTAAKLGVRVMSISRNTKKVGALKIAVDAINTKYVVLMDSDSVLLTNCDGLKRAINEMGLLGLDAMAGRVLPFHPSLKAGSERSLAPEKKGLLLELQSLEYDQSMRLGRGSMYSVDAQSGSYRLKYAEVTCVSGAFGIFRTTVLRQVMTKIKEEFSGEDFERTLRILGINGKVGYSDNIVVLTSAPVNLVSHVKQRVEWSAGLFRCSFSKFGGTVCKRKRAGLTYLTNLIRDIIIHPLKLFSIPFLLLFYPIGFLSLIIFYTALNFLVAKKLNIGNAAPTKALLLLPFYKFYISIVPTTIGYLKAFVYDVKLHTLSRNYRARPIGIIREWNGR